MHMQRVVGGVTAVAALAIGLFFYTTHPVRGSDHQDSNTMINRPGADITDVYVFPAGDNPNNVVLTMNTHPLIPSGMGTATFFDPAVLYQFKISHGSAAGNEDMVIQFVPNGTGSTQTLTMYGPAAPAQVGQTNTVAGAAVATVNYNAASTLTNGIQVFAGPRADPFFFDLAQFFKIIPDRNQAYHQGSATVPAATAATFRGFSAAYNATNQSNCDTTASNDIISSNNFNVLSIVVEVPKSILAPTSGSQVIHVWATTGTTSGQ